MVTVDFHNHWLCGIDYIGESARKDHPEYRLPLTMAIVMSGQYEDDVDISEKVIYTGQGGNNLLGNKHQIADQKMTRGNLGLKNCLDQNVPVRVIRGHQSKTSYVGKVYTFDGLYMVEKYWAEEGVSGFTVCKFLLKRMAGQPLLLTEQGPFDNCKSYKTWIEIESDTPYDTNSTKEMGTSMFNLFTGYQTLKQREQTKANETASVHCGFYSENGGFTILNEDKSYMQTCKSVVSTCAFGGGDDLYQPIGMSDTSLQKVCYVAFWDEVTLAAQEQQGHIINEDRFIGKWRIVIVKNLPFRDQRLNGKIPKMLAHRLFTNAKYSIWVDSKSQFRRDPLGVFEALLWRSKSVFAISKHGARSSVYDETKVVVKKNKATLEEVEVQITQYHHDGLPEDKRFNGKKVMTCNR